MEEFNAWLAEKNLSCREAAPKFGVSFSLVSKWSRGEVTPPELRRKQIEQVTRKAVPADAWKVKA